MNIYLYIDYCLFLRDWLRIQPKAGRGIPRKLALQLGLSTVLISQVLSGTRNLQLDYAYGIATFLALTEEEKDYFLLLVQHENAGNAPFKSHLKHKIEGLRLSANKIEKKVLKDIVLSEQTKARFYSHWLYSAVRLLTDIKGLETPQAIAAELSIEVSQVKKILDFLTANQLCIYKNGSYKMAIKNTHLEEDSPWIFSRQVQWRHKAIQQMERVDNQSIYYTGPMVLSDKDVHWVKEELMKTIKAVVNRVQQSPSEKLMCLNLDWFKV